MNSPSPSNLQSWEEQLLKIINKLLSRKESESFKDPVPWEELGLSDYPEIIKKPMDLNKVKTNLTNHYYESEEMCLEDIRLIWINSMIYNFPGSDIYSTAKSLSDLFENMYISISKDDSNKPPSNDELKRLIELLHRISSKDLSEIINYLDIHYNYCVLKKLPKNEIEINLDLISGKIYRKLRHMIDHFSPELNRKYFTNLIDNNSTVINTLNEGNKRKLSNDDIKISSPKSKKIIKKSTNEIV